MVGLCLDFDFGIGKLPYSCFVLAKYFNGHCLEKPYFEFKPIRQN